MEKELAIKTYKYILEKMNGYKKEQLDNMELWEYESDPIFIGLLELT